jgi:hypothetical protein
MIAMAASALARAVHDYANGNQTKEPKLRFARLLAELFEVRQIMVPTFDFDGIAHQHGRQALIEAYHPSNEAEKRVVDELVNGTMEILRKVARSQTN